MDDPQESTDGGDNGNEEDANKEGDSGGRFVPAEQRESVTSNRRSEEERRGGKALFKGEDKRQADERRKKQDRRAMGLNVPCTTSGSISNLEDWLEDNCKNDFKVVLEKIDDDMVKKHLIIMFKTETDRNTFLDKYREGAD